MICEKCGFTAMNRDTTVDTSQKICTRCGGKLISDNKEEPSMEQTAVVVSGANSFAVSDIEKMAQRMVSSKLFGVQNVDQAVSLMLIAQAEGMHPAIAARDYHIIQGRHTLKADAMLARFQQSGGKVEWGEYTDKKCVGVFSHPQSPKPVSVDWDMERAKKAGIGGKDNWKKYPRQMLKARVVSDGVRLCFPGCAVGVYTPEEVQDFDTTAQPQPVKVVEPIDPRIQELGGMVREISAKSMCAPGVTLKVICGLETFKGISSVTVDEIEPKIHEAYNVFLEENPKPFKVDCPEKMLPKSMEDCDTCAKRKGCPAHA